MKTNTHNISLPKSAFEKIINAMGAVEDAQEHIEDFLMLSNKKIAVEVQRARLDHQKGKVGSWTMLKKEYGV